jgi:hypothetical protein
VYLKTKTLLPSLNIQVVPNIKNKMAKGLEEKKRSGGGVRKNGGKRKVKKGKKKQKKWEAVARAHEEKCDTSLKIHISNYFIYGKC